MAEFIKKIVKFYNDSRNNDNSENVWNKIN